MDEKDQGGTVQMCQLQTPPPAKKLKQSTICFKKALTPVQTGSGQKVTNKKRKLSSDSNNSGPAKGVKTPRSEKKLHDDGVYEVSSSSEADQHVKPTTDVKTTDRPKGCRLLDSFVKVTQQLEVSTSSGEVPDSTEAEAKVEGNKENICTEPTSAADKSTGEDKNDAVESASESKVEEDEKEQQETIEQEKCTSVTEGNDKAKVDEPGVKDSNPEVDCSDSEVKEVTKKDTKEDVKEVAKDEEKEEVAMDVSDGDIKDDSIKEGEVTHGEADSTDEPKKSDTSPNRSSPASACTTPKGANIKPASKKSSIKKTPHTASKAEQKQKEKEERERQKQEEKEKREKEKAEKERQKKEEREKKEREKEELRKKKEQEKKEKAEQKEKERLEKLKQKEDELKKKEEEKQKKLEEKKKEQELKLKKLEEEKQKKEEERLKREEEKRKQEEEKLQVTRKQKSFFTGFFTKKDPDETTAMVTQEDEGPFAQFHVKANMKLAPLHRVESPARSDRRSAVDAVMESPDEPRDLYLSCIKKKGYVKGKGVRTWPYDSDDLKIVESDGSTTKQRMRAKLYQFRENYRPAYYGTWRKTSKVVNPRNPFKQDKDLLDYEVDSDDEWEEEEPGESLSNSEGEGEEDGGDGGGDSDEDGFFVPHGYLSEGEGADDEEEVSTLKARQQAKARAWEIELKKKTHVLTAMIVGCYWCDGNNTGQNYDMLKQYTAVPLMPYPIPITKETTPATNEEKQKAAKLKQKKEKQLKSQAVPTEALPDLIRLMHGNTFGQRAIIREFREYWQRKVNKDKQTNLDPDTGKNDLDTSQGTESQEEMNDSLNQSKPVNEASPSESKPVKYAISKRQLEMTIKDIGKWTRPDGYVICWVVNDDAREKHGLKDLPIQNAWDWIHKPERKVRDTPTPTQNISPKEVAENDQSSTPKTVNSIAQFAQTGVTLPVFTPTCVKPIPKTPAQSPLVVTPKSASTPKATAPLAQKTAAMLQNNAATPKSKPKPVTSFFEKMKNSSCVKNTGPVAMDTSVNDDDDCMIVDSTEPIKNQPSILTAMHKHPPGKPTQANNLPSKPAVKSSQARPVSLQQMQQARVLLKPLNMNQISSTNAPNVQLKSTPKPATQKSVNPKPANQKTIAPKPVNQQSFLPKPANQKAIPFKPTNKVPEVIEID